MDTDCDLRDWRSWRKSAVREGSGSAGTAPVCKMVSGNSKNKSRAEQIIDQINADNAKRIALILVVGFAAYHGILHLRYGKYIYLTSN